MSNTNYDKLIEYLGCSHTMLSKMITLNDGLVDKFKDGKREALVQVIESLIRVYPGISTNGLQHAIETPVQLPSPIERTSVLHFIKLNQIGDISFLCVIANEGFMAYRRTHANTSVHTDKCPECNKELMYLHEYGRLACNNIKCSWVSVEYSHSQKTKVDPEGITTDAHLNAIVGLILKDWHDSEHQFLSSYWELLNPYWSSFFSANCFKTINKKIKDRL